jgi:hypothetical protein
MPEEDEKDTPLSTGMRVRINCGGGIFYYGRLLNPSSNFLNYVKIRTDDGIMDLWDPKYVSRI